MSKPKRYEVVNFYDHIKKEDHAHLHYENEEHMQVKLPARILIVGPTGSGKTTIALNVIKGIGAWDHIIILAKDLTEPLYQHLIDTYRALEKKHKLAKPILLAITEINDLPDIDKDFPEKPSENTLILFDDLICEDKKLMAKIDPWFMRGRKKHVSMMFLTQSYFKTPKFIRDQCQYVIFKKIGTGSDLKRVLSQYSQLDCTLEQLTKLYHYAVSQGNPTTAFFMIDTITKDPQLQLRSQFDPIPGWPVQ